jgi:hypothetical protein
VAAAGWVVARVGEPARPLADLAALHYRVKYGGDEDRPLAGEARRALAALGDLPRAPRADASRAGHETAVR